MRYVPCFEEEQLFSLLQILYLFLFLQPMRLPLPDYQLAYCCLLNMFFVSFFQVTLDGSWQSYWIWEWVFKISISLVNNGEYFSTCWSLCSNIEISILKLYLYVIICYLYAFTIFLYICLIAFNSCPTFSIITWFHNLIFHFLQLNLWVAICL